LQFKANQDSGYRIQDSGYGIQDPSDAGYRILKRGDQM
jgi:hypothetical protein